MYTPPTVNTMAITKRTALPTTNPNLVAFTSPTGHGDSHNPNNIGCKTERIAHGTTTLAFFVNGTSSSLNGSVYCPVHRKEQVWYQHHIQKRPQRKVRKIPERKERQRQLISEEG